MTKKQQKFQRSRLSENHWTSKTEWAIIDYIELYHSQLICLQIFTLIFMFKKAKLPYSSDFSIVNSNFLWRVFTFLTKVSSSSFIVWDFFCMSFESEFFVFLSKYLQICICTATCLDYLFAFSNFSKIYTGFNLKNCWNVKRTLKLL